MANGGNELNVLDIDLDFFLDKTVDGRSDNPANRPDEYGIVPWSVADVTDFLENTLNVGMNNSGAVVQSHHEVFYQWKNLIEARGLVVPFKVVHVDAHSDLGLGCLSSWDYVFLSHSPGYVPSYANHLLERLESI